MEIIISNLIMGMVCLPLFYFVYRKQYELSFWTYFNIYTKTCLVYYIFYFGAVFGYMQDAPSTHLWFPYSFGGMPAYSIGVVGVRWWNHFDIFINGVITILSRNPFFFLVFSLAVYYLVARYKNGKEIALNYVLIILTEIIMILTTIWT